ncbi:hypothetical protein DF286_00935 [Sphingosinicella humi]|uniref:Uncharacterized protein n=1 Tax=Allosphingosinicella humi TaxID=2068657 RepID=A0A2U2IZT4_9SPHN|nr:hypothetical protein DF286_00935 [Sphingosinicella humi]
MPITAISISIWALWSKGYSLFDYPALIAAGELSLGRQGAAWGALIACFIRYYPGAWIALWHGPFLVWEDADNLHLSGIATLPRGEVMASRVIWNFFRKTLEVDVRDGRVIRVPLYFVRESPVEMRKRMENLALTV